MTEEDVRLNATAASLLGFLHAGELSGYELVNVADEVIGDFWTLTRSQAYRELKMLAERGLVDIGETGPRSRRPYRLTEAGRAAFAAWVAQPPGTEQIRYPLLLTLSFGAWLGRDRLLEIVGAHRQIHEQRLQRYEELWKGLERTELGIATDDADDADDADDGTYQRATLAFGLHYERAVLAWMEELPGILAHAHDD